MPKIRVAEDQYTYYIGFEPPLEPSHFARLPNPFKRYASAETAGWPRSAVLSRAGASETVLGLHKESLLLAAQKDFYNLEEIVGLESCAVNGLIRFLEGVTRQIKDTTIDERVYELADDGGGVLSFITPRDEQKLGL
jgi:hypothetical protein